MPKQMFNNIPIAKQQKIIKVAIEEFTSKSFNDVSVNSIIKKANIPRGSFYTYFEDMNDLFNFIFKQVKEDRFKGALHLIKESDKDYFVFIKKLFALDYDSFKSENKYSLFRNYIFYVQSSENISLKESVIMPIKSDLFAGGTKFKDIFNLEKYKMTELEFLDLLEISMLIMVNTFFKSEVDHLSKEEVIELFNKRMTIIEYGVN